MQIETTGPINYNNGCAPDQFKCKHDSRTCIPVSLVCDRIYDCVDHSDELDCNNDVQTIHTVPNRSKKDGASKSAKIIGLL